MKQKNLFSGDLYSTTELDESQNILDETTSQTWSEIFSWSTTSKTKNEPETTETTETETTQSNTTVITVAKDENTYTSKQKNILSNILVNAKTSKNIQTKITSGQVKQQMEFFCEIVFKPQIELKQQDNQVFIERTLKSLQFLSNDGHTYFDHLNILLNGIKEQAISILQNDSGFTSTLTENDKNQLQDIVQKTEIFIEIMDQSRTSIYYFGSENEFKIKQQELLTDFNEISELTELFDKTLPITYREKIYAAKTEAEQNEQLTKLADLESESIVKSSQADIARRESELNISKEQTKLSQQEARDVVKGTLGVVTEGLSEIIENVEKPLSTLADSTINVINKPLKLILDNLYEILKISGIALTIYIVYQVITYTMIFKKCAKIGGNTAENKIIQQQPQQPPQQPPQQQPEQQPQQQPEQQPQQQPQQQIISLFNNFQGLISVIDINGNGQISNILNTYLSDPDTAVRLINLQNYYDHLSDNEKIILYNELEKFALCGKYNGLSTARNKKDFIMIELPNNSIIEVNYDNIIDPNLNNYRMNLSSKLQNCIDSFNNQRIVNNDSVIVLNQDDKTVVQSLLELSKPIAQKESSNLIKQGEQINKEINKEINKGGKNNKKKRTVKIRNTKIKNTFKKNNKNYKTVSHKNIYKKINKTFSHK